MNGPVDCDFCLAGASKQAGLGAKEFLEEEARKAAGVVAEDAIFLEEIIEDDATAELLKSG